MAASHCFTLASIVLFIKAQCFRTDTQHIHGLSESNQTGRTLAPPCPNHSTPAERTVDGRERCHCIEGYEPVRSSTSSDHLERLSTIELAFPGSPRQQWEGECRERACSARTSTSGGYSYLMFEGGGVRGIAYGGAVRALEDAGIFKYIEGYSGASAGSQVAALLAAGYSASELTEALIETDFETLADADSSLLGAYSTLQSKFGYYKGEALEATIDALISKKTKLTNTTFAQLRALQLTGSCKGLTLPALNVNTGKLTWFSAQATPDVPVARAVRASSAIPLFYQPPAITMPDGETYVFVDGGTLRNLPHDAFNVCPDKPALALSLRDYGLLGVQKKMAFDGLREYLMQLYDGLLFGPDSANSLNIGNKAVDIMPVSVDYVSVTDFELGPMTKARLIGDGYNAVIKQLHICRSAGLPLPQTRPDWLLRVQAQLVQKELSKVVSNGWKEFSRWWNLQETKDILRQYNVYTGHIDEPDEDAKHSVEVLHIQGNTYIVVRKPASDQVRNVYLAQGNVSHPPHQASWLAHLQCLVFQLNKITDLWFDDWRQIWRRDDGGMPRPDLSMTFCGNSEFGEQVRTLMGS
eukprot:TRINITY_DN92989_c0_g1_i1.p1 TRINITY_DN92989_c0_g1~~TRINITY_DN92989_c0_g1_i1.p1  ORF type:complete len:582 (-),score=72.59 TRINITY_DN92989_c0_g1_i1:44-1789(-)